MVSSRILFSSLVAVGDDVDVEAWLKQEWCCCLPDARSEEFRRRRNTCPPDLFLYSASAFALASASQLPCPPPSTVCAAGSLPAGLQTSQHSLLLESSVPPRSTFTWFSPESYVALHSPKHYSHISQNNTVFRNVYVMGRWITIN